MSRKIINGISCVVSSLLFLFFFCVLCETINIHYRGVAMKCVAPTKPYHFYFVYSFSESFVLIRQMHFTFKFFESKVHRDFFLFYDATYVRRFFKNNP